MSEVKVQSANQNVKLTKKAWYPTLEFDGNYSIGGRSFTSNYGYNIGAYLNFPQINGMLIRNQIKEAQSMHTKEIANSHSTQNDIYLEIQNAFYSLIEKKNQIPVSTLQVKQAKENYDLSFGRYKVGVGKPKEAQVQYANARVQYYNTLYEFNTARANLEKAIGKNIIDGSVELKKDEKVVSKDVKAEQIKPEQTTTPETQQTKKVKKEKKNGKRDFEFNTYITSRKQSASFGLGDLYPTKQDSNNKTFARYFEVNSIKAKNS